MGGKIAKSGLNPTDLSGLLGLYSVNISAMYLGPRPMSDLKTSTNNKQVKVL